ncbi:proline dehydrogenase family protein [Candidatus Nitrosotenuis aquarius]|uniref:proline dehydrogenase family protein n=1 Tax=Candidatus Nitrosotenuis aquarius TaxID=1846278 RepID=UPI001FE24BC2|nr:proline dehydrogenase family protein [Candidatus Nitrosotenuis aquarius]
MALMERILFGIAKQWIAGDTINDALNAAQVSYKNGMSVIINKLGEYHTSKNIIENTISEYKTIMGSFRKWKVSGAISVKPTQIGLMKSKKECLNNFEILIRAAAKSQTFVWLDMESSDHTDETIQIYENLLARYERLGIAIQANLMRSQGDLADLLSIGGKIRLVKGAYRESPDVALKSKEKIDQNYQRLMKILFESGNEFGIATHDGAMINFAITLAKTHEKKFEFQMLRGIRDELKPDLIKKGFSLSEYIPYGTNWLPYSIRRLKERKRNILLLGSSFLSHKMGT